MSTLEDRYRRLLVFYPREHRARHEEEMVGVMLARTEPGRRYPDPGDVVDLVKGGLQIRLRRSAGPESGAHWREASNVAAVVTPLYLLLASLADAVPLLWFELVMGSLAGTGLLLASAASYALVLGLALRNSRWTAACAWGWAVVGTVLYVAMSLKTIGELGAGAYSVQPLSAGNVVLHNFPDYVAAILLTVAPRPADGAALIGTRSLWRWSAVTLLALNTANAVSGFLFPEVLLTPAVSTGLVAMACGVASRSRVGRRALLLTLPGLAVSYGLNLVSRADMEGWPALLVQGLLAVTLFTLARRGFRPYGSGTVGFPERLV